MTENMKKLAEEASKNEELKEKLMKLDEGSLDQAILIAKEYRLELTEEDLKPENNQSEEDEKLSFDELDVAAGGDGHGKRDKNGTSCWCAFGGGNKGNDDGQCACVLYGQNKGLVCPVAGTFDD